MAPRARVGRLGLVLAVPMLAVVGITSQAAFADSSYSYPDGLGNVWTCDGAGSCTISSGTSEGPTPQYEGPAPDQGSGCPSGEEWGLAATWPFEIPACISPWNDAESYPHAEY